MYREKERQWSWHGENFEEEVGVSFCLSFFQIFFRSVLVHKMVYIILRVQRFKAGQSCQVEKLASLFSISGTNVAHACIFFERAVVRNSHVFPFFVLFYTLLILLRFFGRLPLIWLQDFFSPWWPVGKLSFGKSFWKIGALMNGWLYSTYVLTYIRTQSTDGTAHASNFLPSYSFFPKYYKESTLNWSRMIWYRSLSLSFFFFLLSFPGWPAPPLFLLVV